MTVTTPFAPIELLGTPAENARAATVEVNQLMWAASRLTSVEEVAAIVGAVVALACPERLRPTFQEILRVGREYESLEAREVLLERPLSDWVPVLDGEATAIAMAVADPAAALARALDQALEALISGGDRATAVALDVLTDLLPALDRGVSDLRGSGSAAVARAVTNLTCWAGVGSAGLQGARIGEVVAVVDRHRERAARALAERVRQTA